VENLFADALKPEKSNGSFVWRATRILAQCITQKVLSHRQPRGQFQGHRTPISLHLVAMDPSNDSLNVSRGIPIDPLPTPSRKIAENRYGALTAFLDWAMHCGLCSRYVKVVVASNGRTKLLAKRYIHSNSEIIIFPHSLDLTFSTLRNEVFPEKWNGFNELQALVDGYKSTFDWTENNLTRKDCFSDILVFVACIYGVRRKIQQRKGEPSPVLHTFALYWLSLPPYHGSVLHGWSDEEMALLKDTVIYKDLGDSRRFGHGIFEYVFLPFINKYPNYFGDGFVKFSDFMHVCAVVLSLSYDSVEHDVKLLPIVDLINRKPTNLHNCSLQGVMIDGHVMRTIVTKCAIMAGEELFLEYGHISNSEYLINKHYLPMDRETILHNIKQVVTFNMTKYFNLILRKIHPDSQHLRDAKKSYIFGTTGVPPTLVISEEVLKKFGIQCLRQVLIFVQSDEQAMKQTIQTQRLKYKVNSFLLFQSFVLLIETQIGRPNVRLFQAIAKEPEKFSENMISAILLQMSERIVVEKFINAFIDLFDDIQLPMALSIMGAHMVAEEISHVLMELENMEDRNKPKMCMICGGIDHVVRCSRCHQALYCGPACQQFHWKAGHKKDCRQAPVPPPPIVDDDT
jgi:hypothetical protein